MCYVLNDIRNVYQIFLLRKDKTSRTEPAEILQKDVKYYKNVYKIKCAQDI